MFGINERFVSLEWRRQQDLNIVRPFNDVIERTNRTIYIYISLKLPKRKNDQPLKKKKTKTKTN